MKKILTLILGLIVMNFVTFRGYTVFAESVNKDYDKEIFTEKSMSLEEYYKYADINHDISSYSTKE